jgi:spermidine/putrescine transport system ATP-binding protein
VAPGELSLLSVGKRFGDAVAVDDLDLHIGAGEFFSLLGASGCGKTTTLRMIAGFERPDTGQIVLDGSDIVDIPPHRRPVNTVFQSYALFPFLDVRDNVAFGLRYQPARRAETKKRVDAALELVQMGAFARRKPHQLSGGQQQRVALARALVLEPTVLLLDEPLGALDAKLRKQLQLELRGIQKAVGTTFVYVTHDQEEALTMSDRLAVLLNGHVEQVGSPSDVYARPATAYVAGFLGTANLYDAVVDKVADGVATCRVGTVELRAEATAFSGQGRHVSLVVRPERVEIAPTSDGFARGDCNVYTGRLSSVAFLGAQTQVRMDLGDCQLVAEVANVHGEAPAWLHEGRSACMRVATQAVQLLPTAPTSSAASARSGEPPGSAAPA